jgi:transcriptional regulator GlxA family with amidase domain
MVLPLSKSLAVIPVGKLPQWEASILTGAGMRKKKLASLDLMLALIESDCANAVAAANKPTVDASS